jgi:hypothetical protein
VGLVEEFYVGPDADGADATSTAQVGARTPELIAELIVAQARKADPTHLLSFDEIEALGKRHPPPGLTPGHGRRPWRLSTAAAALCSVAPGARRWWTHPNRRADRRGERR